MIRRRLLLITTSLLIFAHPLCSFGFSENHEIEESILFEWNQVDSHVREELLLDSSKLERFIEGRVQDALLAVFADQNIKSEEDSVTLERGKQLYERRFLTALALKAFDERLKAEAPDFLALARQHYDANKEQFRTNEKVRVSHILIRLDPDHFAEEEVDERLAFIQSLHDRIVNGESFADLAVQYSEDRSSAIRKGVLQGYYEFDQLVQPFAQMAFSMKEGDVSAPVRTRFGFHLIHLHERRPAGYKPFEAVRQELVAKLEKEWIEPRREAFLNEFRDERYRELVTELTNELAPGLAEKTDQAIAE